MNLTEQWAALPAGGFASMALVLDASQSAAACQQETIDLASRLLAGLPARVERSLYFLGNPRPYPASQFSARAVQWFAENRGRASLIGPVFETFDPRVHSNVVVIGSGRVFDLDDWSGVAFWSDMTLVSMGETLQSSAAGATELFSPSPGELVQRVYDPVIRVEISGPGFLPTSWDNPKYVIEEGPDGWRLACERAEEYTVVLRCFIHQDGVAEVVARHASGRETAADLAPAEAPAQEAAPRARLTPEEAAVFRTAAAHAPFRCPRCANQHPWDTLRCRKRGSILGEPVYPTLEERQARGFVLFHVADDAVEFEERSGAVLRLDSGKVAIERGGRAEVHAFSQKTGAWAAEGRVLQPYEAIGSGVYAICL
jgi:hypothetical protein